MNVVEEFRAVFIATLRADPPKLPDNVINKATFSDWINKHFSIHYLAILRRYEDVFGEEAANALVLDAFEAAGLPRPRIG